MLKQKVPFHNLDPNASLRYNNSTCDIMRQDEIEYA